MCLAIPAQIQSISEDRLATCSVLGVTRQCSLDLTPHAQVGDFVLIHAGFSIEVVSPEAAQETLDLIRQFPEFADLDDAPAIQALEA